MLLGQRCPMIVMILGQHLISCLPQQRVPILGLFSKFRICPNAEYLYHPNIETRCCPTIVPIFFATWVASMAHMLAWSANK